MAVRSFFKLTSKDIETTKEPQLKKVSLFIFVATAVFVAFLSGQLWMDRRAIERQESSFNRHQSRQIMIARQAMEDHLRSVINRISIMAVTTVSESLKADSFQFIQDGMTTLVRANDDILALLFRLDNRKDRVFSYHRPLSLGVTALKLGTSALEWDNYVKDTSAPIRVDNVTIIDNHPIMTVVINIYSVRGEKRGQIVAVIDLTSGINRYMVPLRGGIRGSAYLLDDKGIILYHPMISMAGTPIRDIVLPERAGDRSWELIYDQPSGSSSHMEIGPGGVGSTRKLVVWDTIRILNYSFVIILSTPDRDIDVIVREDRALRFLLGLFLIGTAATSLLWWRELSHQKELRRSEARYQAIIDDQYELVTRFTPDGTFTFANDAYCRFFSLDPNSLLGAHLSDIRPQRDVYTITELFQCISKENPSNVNEERIELANGTVKYLSWSNRGIFDGSGNLVEVQAVARDVTDRKNIEIALQEEALQLEKLNRIAQQLTATESRSELVKMLLTALTKDMKLLHASLTLNSDDGSQRVYGEGRIDSAFDIKGDGLNRRSLPLVFRDKNLGSIDVITLQPLDEMETRMISILADHTAGLLELKSLMEMRTQEALVDPLTNIWNRRFILKHLEMEGRRVRRYKEKASLALVDLGDFKLVNDLHGHEAGDATLRKVAKILEETTRSSDMVARYGGDEFLIYMPNTNTNQAAVVMARAAQVVAVRDFPHPIVLDYGIAGIPEDGTDLLEIIKVADRKMYIAKSKRKQKVFS